ncbi:MAG: HypC/HybG/HupF family hydrogenase formation chaperone [Methylovulum sp.]|nr:HypC/HybG/HupF family hydrogenase formation chaperone [Methylovulum sp.]
MCIGLPMQITGQRGEMAVCRYRGRDNLVDMMLVGEQPVGTWLLVFLDTAREVLSEERARHITDALEAMRLAMQGETQIDHLFADLVDREPTLPEFLQS